VGPSAPNLYGFAELAAKNRLPSIYQWETFVRAGGLMSYGPNYAEQLRRSAVYVDKIFKGAKPGDLPRMPLVSHLEVCYGGKADPSGNV